MKSKNVKVVDEHNIDRNANVMFSLELEGSEYVVYWIERDEESNNVFVSKVLKNIDGTYNMLNIDDSDKKEEVSGIVKNLITTAVSDEKDKLVGDTTTLSNGKVVKFVSVSFNKEQNINVQKTYITTVKKEVTKVAETYYDVAEAPKVVEAMPTVVAPVLPEVSVQAPVVETPVVATPAAPVQSADGFVAFGAEAVAPVAPVAPQVVTEAVPQAVVQPTPAVVESITVSQPTVAPVAVEPAPAQQPVVAPAPVETVVPQPVQPTVVTPTPVVPTPVVTSEAVQQAPAVETNQPLVFNASKETNLNAALGEVANSAAIPVENIEPVREFGVEAPVQQPVAQQSTIAPMVQPEVATQQKVLSKKAGFANSKFFVFVAIAFFLASCIFLGYEVYNYFQLIK